MLSSEPLGNVEELSAKLEMMKIGEGEIRQGKRYELVSEFIVVDAEVLGWDSNTGVIRLSLAKVCHWQKGTSLF